jgi:polar amino acid transport system ATP-binding protein
MAQDKRVAVVEARGVHKHFGQNHVLKGVDLTVYKGEVVVIIGPSGGGKSTFLRTINHLDRPDSGEVCINGDALGVSPKGSRRAALSDAGLSRQRRQVGMVFQQFNLFSHMTAFE